METKKVEEMGLKNLANTAHLGFHVEVDKFFNACGAENIACIEILPLYSSAIIAEVDVVKCQRASSITADLEQLNKERDDLLSYFFAITDAAKHAPTAEEKEAHRQLLPVLKPYRGLSYYPNIEESVGVLALFKDLRAEHLAAHITALDFISVMDLLDKKNDDYLELDKQRIIETPSKVVTEAIRTNLDDIYRQIIDRINATVVLATNAAAVTLVENLNNYIDQINTYYNQKIDESRTSSATCISTD